MDTEPFMDIAWRIVARLDPEGALVGAARLAGGVSAQIYTIEYIDSSGARQRVVVRQHGPRDLARNPDIARDEFRLLAALYERGIAVPAPILFDDSMEILSTPYLVVKFIDGETTPTEVPLDALIDQIAGQLAAIHRVDWQESGLATLPDQNDTYLKRVLNRPSELANDMGEDVAREAMEHRGMLAQLNPPVLLHGDFWPGNLLWREGNIVGIIDWEDAAIGDPLADLANCRMELLFAYGVVAMDAFTRRYVEIAPIDLDGMPYWDLFAATGSILRLREWELSPDAVRSMLERHGAFVRQALQRIAANSSNP